MTSLLWNIAQSKDVADIPLITQSAENLGSCLNSVLKAGAVIASGMFGTGLQEEVFLLNFRRVYSHQYRKKNVWKVIAFDVERMRS